MRAYRSIFSMLIAAGLAAPAFAQCELVWTSNWAGNFLFRSSFGFNARAEAADDVEIHDTMHRIVVSGRGYNVEFGILGAWVRIYAHTPDGPGDLLHELYVSSDDPLFVHNAADPQDLDITLPSPIELDGTYFVSVQADVSSLGWWEVWQANQRQAWGQHLWVRDFNAGGLWMPFTDPIFPPNELHSDLGFTIFGGDGDPVGDTGDWRASPVPSPTQRRAVARDIAVRAVDDIWISGENDLPDNNVVPMILHFDGETWQSVPDISPPDDPDFYDYQLSAVDAPAPDEVWFAGARGNVALETWLVRFNGSSYETVPSPVSPPGANGSYLYDVLVVDDTVWVSGSLPREFLLFSLDRDGGNSRIHDLPEFGSINRISSLAASGPHDIWALGGWTPSRPPTYSFPYLAHYDGTEWSLVMPIINSSYRNLTDVVAIAPDDVWIAGFVGAPSRPITVHFDGSTWTQFETPAAIGSLAKSPSGEVYAVGGQSLLKWSGSAWEVLDSFGCIGGTISSLEISSDGAVRSAGNYAAGGFNQPFEAGFFPFPPSCPADMSGASDPNDPAYGVPDSLLDAADFFYFLDQFVAGNLSRADLSGSSDPGDQAYGLPDGSLDAADFFYFLDRFVVGCG